MLAPHRQRARPAGARPTPSATRSAPLYLDVLRRFDGLFDTPLPYISAWHQAPVRVDRDLAYLHLQLFSVRRAAGKLKYLAGSRVGDGVFVNDVAARGGRPAAARGRAVTGAEQRAARVLLAAGSGTPPAAGLGGPGPGQPDRRAHRLQRRLRAAVRAAAPDRGRRRRPRATAAVDGRLRVDAAGR